MVFDRILTGCSFFQISHVSTYNSGDGGEKQANDDDDKKVELPQHGSGEPAVRHGEPMSV